MRVEVGEETYLNSLNLSSHHPSPKPETRHPKHPKHHTSHSALLDSERYQEHRVRVVHVLRYEIGLAFTRLMSEREHVVHV